MNEKNVLSGWRGKVLEALRKWADQSRNADGAANRLRLISARHPAAVTRKTIAKARAMLEELPGDVLNLRDGAELPSSLDGAPPKLCASMLVLTIVGESLACELRSLVESYEPMPFEDNPDACAEVLPKLEPRCWMLRLKSRDFLAQVVQVATAFSADVDAEAREAAHVREKMQWAIALRDSKKAEAEMGEALVESRGETKALKDALQVTRDDWRAAVQKVGELEAKLADAPTIAELTETTRESEKLLRRYVGQWEGDKRMAAAEMMQKLSAEDWGLMKMLLGGKSINEAAKQLGVPRETARRWAHELEEKYGTQIVTRQGRPQKVSKGRMVTFDAGLDRKIGMGGEDAEDC